MNSKSDLNRVVYLLRDMLVSNKDLIKILYYNGRDVDIYDPANDLRPGIAQQTIEDKILPYTKEFTDNEMCCYISMAYGNKNYHARNNHYFNGSTFDIFILSHTDIIFNNFIGNRVYEIEDIIRRVYDGVLVNGDTGICNVVNSEPISAKSTKYVGRKITIAFSDFNGD